MQRAEFTVRFSSWWNDNGFQIVQLEQRDVPPPVSASADLADKRLGLFSIRNGTLPGEQETNVCREQLQSVHPAYTLGCLVPELSPSVCVTEVKIE